VRSPKIASKNYREKKKKRSAIYFTPGLRTYCFIASSCAIKQLLTRYLRLAAGRCA